MQHMQYVACSMQHMVKTTRQPHNNLTHRNIRQIKPEPEQLVLTQMKLTQFYVHRFVSTLAPKRIEAMVGCGKYESTTQNLIGSKKHIMCVGGFVSHNFVSRFVCPSIRVCVPHMLVCQCVHPSMCSPMSVREAFIRKKPEIVWQFAKLFLFLQNYFRFFLVLLKKPD